MKKLLTFVVLLTMSSPPLLWATPRTVTITWTMTHTAYVKSYKVYYANNSAMINQTLHKACTTPIENPTNAFTITCENIDLKNNQPYFFTIAAQTINSGVRSLSLTR